MFVVHTFCFMFSVRCGAIIIGCLTFVVAGIPFFMIILNMNNVEVTDHIIDILKTIKVNPDTIKMLRIEEETSTYMIVSLCYLSMLMATCLILIWAAYQCKSNYLYPFLIFFSTYIFIIGGGMVVLLLVLKARNWGLGNLILYSNLLVLLFFFHLYQWIVVYSLMQIIDELKRRLNQRKNRKNSGIKSRTKLRIKY